VLEQSSTPPRLLERILLLLPLPTLRYRPRHPADRLAAVRQILAVDRVAHLLHRVPAEDWTFVVGVQSIYSDSLRPERVTGVLAED